MIGQCPHCYQNVTSVNMAAIEAHATGRVWHVVSYACPACKRVLAVVPDPVAQSADLADAIEHAVRRMGRA